MYFWLPKKFSFKNYYQKWSNSASSADSRWTNNASVYKRIFFKLTFELRLRSLSYHFLKVCIEDLTMYSILKTHSKQNSADPKPEWDRSGAVWDHSPAQPPTEQNKATQKENHYVSHPGLYDPSRQWIRANKLKEETSDYKTTASSGVQLAQWQRQNERLQSNGLPRLYTNNMTNTNTSTTRDKPSGVGHRRKANKIAKQPR